MRQIRRLLTGQILPDGGSVRRAPGVRVRSLQQDPVFERNSTVDSVLNAAFHDLDALEVGAGRLLRAGVLHRPHREPRALPAAHGTDLAAHRRAGFVRAGDEVGAAAGDQESEGAEEWTQRHGP